jgi:hypothetical protein
MLEYSLKENTDIRYNKVWIRKQKQEEKVNEEFLEIILMGFT